MLKLSWFFVLLLLVNVNNLSAQQDTLFWFAAPEISSGEGDSPIALNFSTYNQSADIVISQPANGAFADISLTIAANSFQSVNLTTFLADIESSGGNIVDDSGIKITSTTPITANYSINAATNKEIFSLKGNKGVGLEFYTPFQKFWDNAVTAPTTFSSIEVVATEDNTTVLITPRAAITGHAQDATFSVVLQAGETYSARDVNVTASSSLAGSIVSANKPISVTVFSGALDNAGCNSSVGDQLVSRDYLGNDFIIKKSTATNERVYILATENTTFIDITNSGTTSTLINWGETYELPITDDISFIETSKPVYVFHVSGNGCNLGGAQVPTVSCAGKSEQAFNRISSDSLGLLVYIRSGFEGDFSINGNTSLLQASDFDVVPGTASEYVVALKYFTTAQIGVGSYNSIVNGTDIFGLAIINGESGNGSGYTYLSEFTSYPDIFAGSDGTVCANSTFNLNGFIGGGDVDIKWGGTGFGSFDSGVNAITNVYIPSDLDTLISPIQLVLSSNGKCPLVKDTLMLTVTPAPLVNASTDQVVCANNAVIELDGSVTGGATTGLWTRTGTGDFVDDEDLGTNYIPSDADTSSGTVKIYLESTNNGGCLVERDSMILTISQSPLVDAGADTIRVCANNPDFSVSGTVSAGASTGKWTTSGNGLFLPSNLDLSTNYQPSPQDVSAGQIKLFLESRDHGDCIKVKDSIVVLFTSPPIVYAGQNLSSCTNSAEVDLSGIVSGPTVTGEWSNGSGDFVTGVTDLSTVYVPTQAEVDAGFVVLVLTSTNNLNCLAEDDQMQINFVAPPVANFSAVEVCQVDTTFLTNFSLNGAGSITDWNWDFGNSETSNDVNTSIIYDDFGSYDVRLIVESDFGCFDTIVKTVNSLEKPNADFDFTSSCDNDQIVISFTDASTMSSSSINSWFYDFGGEGSQSTQNPIQLFNGEGNYTITQMVQSVQGCRDTVKKVINVPPRPIADFVLNSSNGQNIGALYTFTDNSINAVDWSWDLGNGELAETPDAATYYFQNGNYTVTQYVTSSFGCVDSLSVDIEIKTVVNEISKLIPNAISPNGDGKNDVWKLEFISLLNPFAEIVIVNRWGQTIFESIGYASPWDGTYENENVPEGTYYYIIKISDEEIYEGTILVLKSADN
jgi:gliding motility-associated-like protein